MASKEAVADVLDEAYGLLGANGEHWTQGQMRRKENGEASYCVVGAVREVMQHRMVRADFFQRHAVEKAAIVALASVHHRGATEMDTAVEYVTTWNDRSRTTWENVEERFRIAKQRVLKSK